MSRPGPRSFSAWSMICRAVDLDGSGGAAPCRRPSACRWRWVSRASASRYLRFLGSLARTAESSARASSRRSRAASMSRRRRVSDSTDWGSAFSASRRDRSTSGQFRWSRGWRIVCWSRSRTRSSRHSGLRSASGSRIVTAWSSLPERARACASSRRADSGPRSPSAAWRRASSRCSSSPTRP